ADPHQRPCLSSGAILARRANCSRPAVARQAAGGGAAPITVHLLSTGGRGGRPHPGPLPEGEGTWAGPDRAIGDGLELGDAPPPVGGGTWAGPDRAIGDPH